MLEKFLNIWNGEPEPQTYTLPRGFASSGDAACCWLATYGAGRIEYVLSCYCAQVYELLPDERGFASHEHNCAGHQWRAVFELLDYPARIGK